MTKAILSFLFVLPFVTGYCQIRQSEENSDEASILENIHLFNYRKSNTKTVKFPQRKFDSPLFCDEMEAYKNGFLINSITSSRNGRTADFTTTFFYYEPNQKSLTKVSIENADTIESVVCTGNNAYYSFIKNGKRQIGFLEGHHYENLLDRAPSSIRAHIDSMKWIKLGLNKDTLFVMTPQNLFTVANDNWKERVDHYSQNSVQTGILYKANNLLMPTKNLVIQNNEVYFLREIVQGRQCNLMKLDLITGVIVDFFASLEYRDNYMKVVNDFFFLKDTSLLVFASRLMFREMLINKKDNRPSIWMFNNVFTTSSGEKFEASLTTGLCLDDSLVLASGKGLFSKSGEVIRPLINFNNPTQMIKDPEGNIEFSFVPRCIKKLRSNVFLIGGLWGGLYEIDLLSNKLLCLDDIDSDKIKTTELGNL